MSSVAEAIVAGARRRARLGARRSATRADWEPVFSPLAPDALRARARDGLRGLPRALRPAAALRRRPTRDEAVLLGDYLYAHGLVRIAEAGGVDAVAAMAELISRCAALRADGAPGDGDAWVEAARALGGDAGRRRGRARARPPLR